MRFFKFITVLLFFISCNSWKSSIVKEGSIDDARKNLIIDYGNSLKSKKNKVYEVIKTPETDDLYVFHILKSDKIYPDERDTLGKPPKSYIPTKYLEVNSRLFLWMDKNYPITKDLVTVLEKYKVLDSIFIKRDGESIPYDEYPKVFSGQKYVPCYYICKNDLSNYFSERRIVRRKPEDYPDLKCNDNKTSQ